MNDHPQGMPKPNAIDNLIVFVVQLSIENTWKIDKIVSAIVYRR